jgi:hypothetical protein
MHRFTDNADKIGKEGFGRFLCRTPRGYVLLYGADLDRKLLFFPNGKQFWSNELLSFVLEVGDDGRLIGTRVRRAASPEAGTILNFSRLHKHVPLKTTVGQIHGDDGRVLPFRLSDVILDRIGRRRMSPSTPVRFRTIANGEGTEFATDIQNGSLDLDRLDPSLHEEVCEVVFWDRNVGFALRSNGDRNFFALDDIVTTGADGLQTGSIIRCLPEVGWNKRLGGFAGRLRDVKICDGDKLEPSRIYAPGSIEAHFLAAAGRQGERL